MGYRRGRALAEAWRGVEGARLVAVADLLPERREQARQELGEIACYPDHVAMLEAARLDVLTVATTGQFHARSFTTLRRGASAASTARSRWPARWPTPTP